MVLAVLATAATTTTATLTGALTTAPAATLTTAALTGPLATTTTTATALTWAFCLLPFSLLLQLVLLHPVLPIVSVCHVAS